MPPDLFSKCARVQALLDRSPTLHSSHSCWERPDPVHLPPTWVPIPISSRGHPEVALHLSLPKKRRILLLDGRLELQYTMSQRRYMIYRGMNSWSNCTSADILDGQTGLESFTWKLSYSVQKRGLWIMEGPTSEVPRLGGVGTPYIGMGPLRNFD
ncbi:hypothetical protein ARMSODRAFT_978117 [Armillaria solidipes]|uniref:Uncharacterized protein n=1 Tax=Armillaria solidipes TaxID=1076256 RepID=A0A2H3B7J4_9AGAR|nr:hypothetical protein ARMSODRAFT_978117 [Armillaria solidipes]